MLAAQKIGASAVFDSLIDGNIFMAPPAFAEVYLLDYEASENNSSFRSQLDHSWPVSITECPRLKLPYALFPSILHSNLCGIIGQRIADFQLQLNLP
jgi:hypothetical protein